MFATGNQSCWHGQFAHARVQARLPWEFRFFAFTTFTFALPKVRIRIKKLEVHFLWKMHLFV